MNYIEGIYREPALVLEAIIILLSIEIGTFFFSRFIKEEQRTKNFIRLAWALFFFAYSGMTSFFILSDYFSLVENRLFLVNIGYFFMAMGALVFTFNAERELDQRKHSLFFILLALIIFLMLDFFIMLIAPYYLVIFAWIPFIIILLNYLMRAFSKIKEYRSHIYGCFVGFLVFGIGFFFTIDLLVDSLGPISRMIGNIAIIFGISLASWQFIGLPSLREIDWATQLNNLILMHKSGTCIYEYNFTGDQVEKDSSEIVQYMAGSLIGITQMITELIQSKQKLEIMDHQDKLIIFSYGENIIAALIVKKDLEIYRKKLEKLLNEIEVIYKDYLEDWDGRTEYFKPIEKFIKRIFS